MSKFASLRDEVVYRATLDGSDDTIGTVDDIGWHGLVLNFYGRDYIVSEDSQGFVYVDSYATTFTEDGVTYRSAESGNAWADIFVAYEAWTINNDTEDD